NKSHISCRNLKPQLKIGLTLAICFIAFFAAVHLFKPRTDDGKAVASFNLGKTETSSSAYSGTTSCSTENSCFSARHLLLIVDNPHPLCQRVARLLEQQLKDCPLI